MKDNVDLEKLLDSIVDFCGESPIRPVLRGGTGTLDMLATEGFELLLDEDVLDKMFQGH